MSSASGNSYIGKIVSLISTANIRYEGTIYMIDNDKITLKNVRIFGTEDRKCDVFIDMLKDMRPVISFNRTGIRSINIIPDYTFFDPSIIDQSGSAEIQAENTSLPQNQPQQRRGNNNNGKRIEHGLRQSDILKTLPDVEEEPVSNTFDFEESNKLFDKEADAIESTAPAYKKADFFDNLQERPSEKEGGRFNRQKDVETFGKKSLDERNREYRSRNNNRYQNRNNYQRGNQRSNNRQQRNNFYRRPNFNNGVTESQGTSEL